jgi:hypothetical protein
MTGGVILSSLSTENLIQQQSYRQSTDWFILTTQLLILIGFLLIAAGVILLLARKPKNLPGNLSMNPP